MRVEIERKTTLRIPLIHLEGITCFGDTLVSPGLIHRCGEDGRSLVFLDRGGRFKARVSGPVNGNVLLRHAQYLALQDANSVSKIARSLVAGKIQNARQVLLRAAREANDDPDRVRLRHAITSLEQNLSRLQGAQNVDVIRGYEGDSARAYFSAFDRMVRVDRETFAFTGRSRRPPLDPMNATLSFLYTLLLSDCTAALEGVGLDPQVGFLHTIRPGRPALALDLLEELRSFVADRLALTLINRGQLSARDFQYQVGGSVLLTEDGRRTVISAFQKRKQENVRHRLLDRLVPLGLVPHLQGRILARHLRGDVDDYIPFLAR